MELRVCTYIDNCQTCKKDKCHTQKYGHLPLPDTDVDPLEIIQVDLFGQWNFSNKNGIDRKIKGVSVIDVG